MYYYVKYLTKFVFPLISFFLFVPINQAAFLVKDKVIYSPDMDDNFWGFQIKLQGGRMLVSNYATIDGFGLSGGVDYYKQDAAAGAWILKQRIEPPIDPAIEVGSLSFGQTALDNDRLLIGATWADVGNRFAGGGFQQDAGKVFLYLYDSARDEWVFEQDFQASNAERADAFATPAFSGSQVLIGADLKDIGGVDNAGVVYVFLQDDVSGEWQEIQKLESTALTNSSYFGGHLYVCGNQFFASASNVQNDPNGDGVKRSGVYIYEKGEDDFWFQKRLLLSDTEDTGDIFGGKLLCDENRLIISAFQEDTVSNLNGAVYFYVKDNIGNWVRQQKLVGVRFFENSRSLGSSRFGVGMTWENDTLLKP